MSRSSLFTLIQIVALMALPMASAFAPLQRHVLSKRPLFSAANGDADDQLVACRIVVKGDVQGGYYRTCVLNEASRFRSLVGTMSPPEDDSDTAEIYVEGNRKMVDGFIRWCKRADKNVGLSQVVKVEDVIEESPTGLYDGFYVKTH